ncbi:VanZ family protein [Halobellus rufus]|uniref:VanZ family protein n=1 Tax=Halobellus rufus TaxID=1448860 RepID=UPI000679C314|nr:VanZ family protein [Halobellus rufus]
MDGADADRSGRQRRRGSRRVRRLAAAWIGLVVFASAIDPSVVFDTFGGLSTVGATISGDGSPGIVDSVAAHVDVFALSHLVAYGVLAWLLADALGVKDGRSRHYLRGLLVAAVLASAVGVGVELIQAPLAVRTASAVDAAVNGVGALAGLGIRAGVRRVRAIRR